MLGHWAFGENQLKSVTIPKSVTNIQNNPFSGNANLVNITVDSANPNYKSYNDAIYTKDGKTLITGTENNANNMLSTVETIGTSAYSRMGIKTVTIPNNVKTIGWSAFSDNQLTSVSIGSGLSSSVNESFRDNPTLTTITINSANTKYMSSNNGVYTKDGKTLVFGTKTCSNNILSTTTTIGPTAFYGMGLTSVTIPKGVTKIDSSAFSYNKLTSVTIPNSVTSIGSFSFSENRITQGNFKIDNKSGNVSIGSSAFIWNGTNGNTTITPTYLR